MNLATLLAGLKFQKTPVESCERDEAIGRRVTRGVAKGSIALQEGRYQTDNDRRRRKVAILGHTFAR